MSLVFVHPISFIKFSQMFINVCWLYRRYPPYFDFILISWGLLYLIPWIPTLNNLAFYLKYKLITEISLIIHIIMNHHFENKLKMLLKWHSYRSNGAFWFIGISSHFFWILGFILHFLTNIYIIIIIIIFYQKYIWVTVLF